MSRQLRIGVDVDGVLADFNGPFIDRVIDITGQDKFPPRPFDIPTWNYPEHYGYSPLQVDAVWEDIKADRLFWFGLPPLRHAKDILAILAARESRGDEVYFITSRPGIDAKLQTELWLRRQCPIITGRYPTVLISSQKGFCARALRLDVYVDDRTENVVSAATEAPWCFPVLFDQPWNRIPDPPFARRISSAAQFAAVLRETDDAFSADAVSSNACRPAA